MRWLITILSLAVGLSVAAAPASARPDADTQIYVARLLSASGYDPGPADGIWGPRTEAAFRSFLEDRDLPYEFSDRVWDALEQAAIEHARSARPPARSAASGRAGQCAEPSAEYEVALGKIQARTELAGEHSAEKSCGLLNLARAVIWKTLRCFNDPILTAEQIEKVKADFAAVTGYIPQLKAAYAEGSRSGRQTSQPPDGGQLPVLAACSLHARGSRLQGIAGRSESGRAGTLRSVLPGVGEAMETVSVVTCARPNGAHGGSMAQVAVRPWLGPCGTLRDSSFGLQERIYRDPAHDALLCRGGGCRVVRAATSFLDNSASRFTTCSAVHELVRTRWLCGPEQMATMWRTAIATSRTPLTFAANLAHGVGRKITGFSGPIAFASTARTIATTRSPLSRYSNCQL